MVRVSTRPGQQDSAGQHRECRRDQRPPEARHVARPKGQHQTGNAADQEHPAEEDRNRKACERRHDHGAEAKNDQQDAFEQEGLPMLAHGGAHLGLKFAEFIRKGHGSTPGTGAQDRTGRS
jgi:hypothetical protein